MKKITSLVYISLMVLLINQAIAQNLIAVQNGSKQTFYTNLDDVITNAQAKDTVYIPGGIFPVTNNNLTINKELHFIGAGIFRDSTKATNLTRIDATMTLVAEANNSSFEGIYFFNGSINAGDEDIDNLSISRCHLQNINLSRLSSNWLVSGNIIDNGINGTNPSFAPSIPNAQSNYISNNIIGYLISNFGPNNVFKNNTLLSNLGENIANISNCVLENNIFLYYQGMNFGISNCILRNNLSVGAFGFNTTNNIENNNYTSQPINSIFINYSESGIPVYSDTDDYNLQPNCPGKNAGTDGTDVGIYGGAYPWKDGSIPSNPHFQSIQIAPKTDTNGNLNVKIKVAAQDH